MIHPKANVLSNKIGTGTTIWQFAIVLEGALIGENCNINCHTFIENEVLIGDNVTIKSGVYLWDGIVIENDVFIGPNATFTNDKFPKSRVRPERFQNILVKSNASIGANATILGGVTIGRNSLVGAGALVTKDVPDNSLVVGSPAKVVAYLDDFGNKLKWVGDCYTDSVGNKYYYKQI